MQVDNSPQYDQSYDGEPSPPTSHGSDQPFGKHKGRAIEWKWETDSYGTPCIAVMFSIDGGSFDGYRVDGKLYLDNEKADKHGRTARERSMRALRAMGLVGELTYELDGIDANVVDLVIDTNAKGYAFVKWVNDPNAGNGRTLKVFNEPPRQQIASFLAQLNARENAVAARAHASGTAPIQGGRPQPRQAQQAAQGGQRTQQGTQQPAQPRQTPAQGPQTRGAQGGQQTRQAPPRMAPQGGQDFGDDDIPFDGAAVGR